MDVIGCLLAEALFINGVNVVLHHARHDYDYYYSQRHRLTEYPEQPAVRPLIPAEPVNNASQCLRTCRRFHYGSPTDITDLPAKFFPCPEWPNGRVTERPGIFDMVTLYLFQHDSSSVGASTAPVESPSIITHEILELVQCTKRL